MITKVINVNLHQPIYERLTAKQGDIASRCLLFHLLDGDKPFDLSNRTVRVYAIKPDKTEIFNDLTINDASKGYCTLELTSQCLASAGVVKMELYISESGKVLTSIPFELEVIACINTANGVTSTNEFSALEVALGSLQDYDNLKEEVIEARGSNTSLKTAMDKKVDKSTTLPLQANLNDYTSPGLFRTSNSGHASGCLNIPKTSMLSFQLLVPNTTNSADYTTQILIETGNNDVWVRNKHNKVWNAWEKVVTTKHIGEYNMYLSNYRFVATSFNNDNMKLVMMYSDDGVYWYVPNPSGDFTSTTGNGTLRDPSLIKIGEWFYICYTKIAWGTGSTVGYCRTKDFVNFEEFADIKVGNFNKLWAPEFFRDTATTKLYLVFSGSTSTTTDSFKGYLQEVSINDSTGAMTLVNSPIELTGDVASKNAIDFSILQDANRYYLAYKDETNKYLCIAQSFTLTGDYKDIKVGVMPNTEGAQIVKMDGFYKIFLDEYDGGGRKIGSVDVYDAFISFGNFAQMKTSCGFVGSHMFVYDTAKVPACTSALKPACIVKRTATSKIINNTVITLNYGEKVKISDMDLTGTANIVIPTEGFYCATFGVSWEANNNGYRNIAIELNDGGDTYSAVAISQVPAVQNEQTVQQITAMFYAYAGAKVRTTVKQTSGVALLISNWSNSGVFTCHKV